MANINLFQEGDNQAPQRNGIPPWAKTPITLDYLQISKKEAQTNQAKVRALFYKYKMQKQNAVEAYTDGSLNKERKNTTYAVILPAFNIEETGTLAEGTSIFTAEAYGIHRAMEIAYNYPGDIDELVIFTDSQSVAKALASLENETQHHSRYYPNIIELKKFRHQDNNLLDTQPCRCPKKRESRYPRFEFALDRPRSRTNNSLSIAEKTAIYKQYLRKIYMEKLKHGQVKENIH